MSKAVMISIRQKWCEMIVSRKKTVEVRKTRPRLEPPFRCYIYCTQSKHPYDDFISVDTEDGTVGFFGGGKVIGEFVCDAIFPISVKYSDTESRLALREFPFTCLTDKQIMDYLGNGKEGCGWHISNLIIYDQPRKIGEFRRICHNDLYCESCAMYHTHNGNCGNYSLQVRRPPQSWCYVEELEENNGR